MDNNQLPLINGLPLPELLMTLMQSGKWKHPGDELISRVIPSLTEPVDFLPIKGIISNTNSMGRLADDPELSSTFRMFHGTKQSIFPELPWLDMDRSILIAVNRELGDDIAIALDYRTSMDNPRVVASEWNSEGHFWREVTPTFSEFVELVGLK